MSRPFPQRSSSSGSYVRVNGKIRAREVRVIGIDGQQLGVMPLADAIRQAQLVAVDLVEIAPNATPPVCRIVDYGKFRYEQAKREKESKKHQHANKVKEVQLSPGIDPHDFGVKLNHAIDFLCEDMKVKVTLRFRGREMAHKEFGFQQVEKFIKAIMPWGHPDFAPKLIGKGINVMISPLPRTKRARHPGEDGSGPMEAPAGQNGSISEPPLQREREREREAVREESASAAEFVNNPFAQLEK